MTRLRTVFGAMIVTLFILANHNVYSQSNGVGLIGKAFYALTVSNADSTAAWYEGLFGLKLLKEIKIADGGHIRIEGNEFMMVEILQPKDSRGLDACSLQRNQSHLLRGYFKTGLFVKDIAVAREYFKIKGIAVRHDVFRDQETATASFILEDPDGNMLQFIQAQNVKAGK